MSKRSMIWEERLAEQARRGMSNKALAREYGVSHHTVAYWRVRFGMGARRQMPKVVSISGLLPAGNGLALSDGSQAAHVEIETRGVRLRVPADISEDGLRRIMRAVAP